MPAKRKAASPKDSTATIGFEAKLWLTADKLRNNMDAADWSGATKSLPKESPKGERGGANQYKHVVLGLIFLKYISDTFEEHRAKLLAGSTRASRVGSGALADPLDQYAVANAEDPDEYKAENVFWVPADARWSHLQASAKQPTIGKTVDWRMANAEVRVANRSRFTSTFENRQSKFA